MGVSFSVPTLDETLWRVTEPGTAPPRQRLRAVRLLADAGIRVGVALAPILPGLSDGPELLLEAVRAARDAGAGHLWTELVHPKPGSREHFLESIAGVWPAEAKRLATLYATRAYAPERDRKANAALVSGIARQYPLREGLPAPIEPEPPRLALQLGLAFDPLPEARAGQTAGGNHGRARNRLPAPSGREPGSRASRRAGPARDPGDGQDDRLG